MAPPGGVHGPLQPLRLHAPRLSQARPGDWAVELDDIDVTTLVSVEGDQLVLRPVEALAPGTHRLRLVEYREDGEILERGLWQFQVRRSRHFETWRGAAAIDLAVAQRLTDHGSTEQREGPQQEGTFRAGGGLSSDRWRMAGEVELLYLPLAEQRPEGMEEWDGSYQARLRSGPWRMLAGPQEPLGDHLIARRFRRRGVSLGLVREETGFLLKGFVLNAAEQGGPAGDGDNRFSGGRWTWRPIPNHPDALILDGVWFQGRDPGREGIGTSGDPSAQDNRAWSITAESLWQARRLRLRSELAGTRLGVVGNEGDSFQDRAHSLLLGYDLPTEFPLRVVLEQRRVGTFFRSLANPEGITDREGLQARIFTRWNDFDLAGGWSNEQDNVADLAFLPKIETRRATLDLTWKEASPVLRPWTGLPRLTLGWNRVRQAVIRGNETTPAGGVRTTWEWRLRLGLSHEWGELGAGLSQARDEDLRKARTSDTLSGEFTATAKLHRALYLDLTWQRERTRGTDDPELTSDTGNLQLTYAPRRSLSLHGALGLVRMDNAEGTTEDRRITLAARWQSLMAGTRRPALTWTLEGDHQRRGTSLTPSTSYQVILRLEMSWRTSKAP